MMKTAQKLFFCAKFYNYVLCVCCVVHCLYRRVSLCRSYSFKVLKYILIFCERNMYLCEKINQEVLIDDKVFKFLCCFLGGSNSFRMNSNSSLIRLARGFD